MKNEEIELWFDNENIDRSEWESKLHPTIGEMDKSMDSEQQRIYLEVICGHG